MEDLRPDLCVIGSDPAGVELAFATAGLGGSVVLVTLDEAALSPALVRLRALDGQVFTGMGAFLDPKRFSAGQRMIRANRFVLAPGAVTMMPAIAGAEQVTGTRGGALLVIGGGPEAAALAERESRSGAVVSLLSDTPFLAGFDHEAVDLIRHRLLRAGITINDAIAFETCAITPVAGRFQLDLPASAPILFDRLAPCGAEVPAFAGLALEKAGLRLANGVLALDAAGKTANARIFVLGAASGPGHAQRHASAIGTLLQEIFTGKAKPPPQALHTRLCLTSPAIAETGVQESRIPPDRRADHRFYRTPLPDGFIKVITTPKGLIRGVSIVGARAPELIVPFVQAMADGKPLPALASLPIAGPGPAVAIRSVARLALLDSLRGSWWLKLMRLLGLTRFTGSARLGGG